MTIFIGKMLMKNLNMAGELLLKKFLLTFSQYIIRLRPKIQPIESKEYAWANVPMAYGEKNYTAADFAKKHKYITLTNQFGSTLIQSLFVYKNVLTRSTSSGSIISKNDYKNHGKLIFLLKILSRVEGLTKSLKYDKILSEYIGIVVYFDGSKKSAKHFAESRQNKKQNEQLPLTTEGDTFGCRAVSERRAGPASTKPSLSGQFIERISDTFCFLAERFLFKRSPFDKAQGDKSQKRSNPVRKLLRVGSNANEGIGRPAINTIDICVWWFSNGTSKNKNQYLYDRGALSAPRHPVRDRSKQDDRYPLGGRGINPESNARQPRLALLYQISGGRNNPLGSGNQLLPETRVVKSTRNEQRGRAHARQHAISSLGVLLFHFVRHVTDNVKNLFVTTASTV